MLSKFKSSSFGCPIPACISVFLSILVRLGSTHPLACDTNTWKSSFDTPPRGLPSENYHTAFFSPRIDAMLHCRYWDERSTARLRAKLWSLYQAPFSPQCQLYIVQVLFHVPPHLPRRRACAYRFTEYYTNGILQQHSNVVWKKEHGVEWSAVRSKIGRDMSISRNLICPSPEGPCSSSQTKPEVSVASPVIIPAPRLP